MTFGEVGSSVLLGQVFQLYFKNAPAAPFDAGSIAMAREYVARILTTMFAPYHNMAMEIAARKG